MHAIRSTVTPALVLAASVAGVAPAAAQGCILLRQTSPMFGTTPIDQQSGTWNVTFTGRNSTADKHSNGTERQVQREIDQTYVVNRQNSMTATISYQWSPRISVSGSVPWIEASWGIPSPRTGGPSARANENARGLGDITTLARFAIMNPAGFHTWNMTIGGGVKLPTGNNESVDTFPDNTGNNNQPRYVDISANPGDGGWGIILDLQGYKTMGRVTAFGSGTYLSNPRDTGGPSRANLVSATAPTNVNTVSDQFLFRAGTTVGITRWLAGSIAWRMEGVPRYDAIGGSHGFRRPGVEMYWEPGVTVTAGRSAISVNVPVGYYYNRFRNPYTGIPGDSTFPEYVAIATYSLQLGHLGGQQPHPIMTDHEAPAPAPSAKPSGSGSAGESR